MVALKAVYWLATENLPLSKYNSFMSFLKMLKVPDIEHHKCSKNIDYSSKTSGYSFLEVISNMIDENITKKCYFLLL